MKNKKKLFIIIGIVLIIIIFIFIIINLKSNIIFNDSNELMFKIEHNYGNSQTNINNEGLIAGNSQYIYYSSQTGLKYCIKQYNIEAQEGIDLVTSNSPINYINLYSNEIYYLTENSIFKINQNAEERQLVIENATNFTIVDDYIFYIKKTDSSNKELYKVKIGEKNNKKVTSKCVKEFSIFGNVIAFVDKENSKLYTVDLDGKNEKVICEDEVKNITTYNDYVFFNSNTTGTFCRIETDGTGLKDIFKDNQYNYLIYNGKIIIPNYSFIFYDFDGQEIKKYKEQDNDTIYKNDMFVNLGVTNGIILYHSSSIKEDIFEFVAIPD